MVIVAGTATHSAMCSDGFFVNSMHLWEEFSSVIVDDEDGTNSMAFDCQNPLTGETEDKGLVMSTKRGTKYKGVTFSANRYLCGAKVQVDSSIE